MKPGQWPGTLERIAARVGAKGGNLIRANAAGIDMVSSPGIAELAAEFIRLGYNRDNTRVARRLARASHPGFLTDGDLHSPEELRSLPMYRDFLTPHGADAGAGTIIQGADNDALIVAIEGFQSQGCGYKAVPFLDSIRPHLGRAVALSSQVQAAHAATLVEAFNVAGLAIALLDANGKVVSATDQFADAFDDVLLDSGNRLRAVDARTDRRLADTLADMRGGVDSASIAIRDPEQFGRAVLHLVPARNEARDLFSHVRTFALLSKPDNHFLPDADIISALFDLTPAEARVARGIAKGKSLRELANEFNVSDETVRTQLKRVFAKTSTSRQGELIFLLARLGGNIEPTAACC
jgi:DNA-binding CsgD family transcriptional regulator